MLLIFIKNPKMGKVKSRLAKSIGDEKARSVYKKLLLKMKETAKGLDIYAGFIDDVILKNHAIANTVQWFSK